MRTLDAVCASVNGVPLHDQSESLDAVCLRQRACVELLRQAAQVAGFLQATEPPTRAGVVSEQTSQAIERFIEREIQSPDIADEACRRYYAAHASRFRIGERVHARHILFALRPESALEPIRQRAESCLVDLRAGDFQAERFAGSARHLSNCPSGAQGGDLGWLMRQDCVPEFAQALLDSTHVGVLPHLVRTRFGFHVVQVLAREPGVEPAYESVRPAIEAHLRAHAYAGAVSRYIQSLAQRATLAGIAIGDAESPYLQ